MSHKLLTFASLFGDSRYHTRLVGFTIVSLALERQFVWSRPAYWIRAEILAFGSWNVGHVSVLQFVEDLALCWVVPVVARRESEPVEEVD